MPGDFFCIYEPFQHEGHGSGGNGCCGAGTGTCGKTSAGKGSCDVDSGSGDVRPQSSCAGVSTAGSLGDRTGGSVVSGGDYRTFRSAGQVSVLYGSDSRKKTSPSRNPVRGSHMWKLPSAMKSGSTRIFQMPGAGASKRNDTSSELLFLDQKPVIHGDFCPLEEKVCLCSGIRPERNAGCVFPGGRNNGDGQDVWHLGPQFHGKSGDAFADAQFHGFCSGILFNGAVEVMTLIRFVPVPVTVM